MKIKKLTIKNFGKIQNRDFEFSPGINVLYGENESGKTTMHIFLKSMLYGIQRQRGRAARKDVYATYEPWENPGVYGGILWFENGGKNFRLTRNFHKTAPMQELLCEDDGELLDMEQGDLDVILGGISEVVYENTVSIGQLKSVTGQDLVRELQNYMAAYQGIGDSSVDLGRAMQMLKMSRKGYQVQADRQRKEAEKEQEKLAANMQYLQREMAELKERQSDLEGQMEGKRFPDGEEGEQLLEERIRAVEKKQSRLHMSAGAGTAVMLLLAVLTAVFAGFHWMSVLFAAAGLLTAIWAIVTDRRQSAELARRKKQKVRWQQKQEKRKWSRDSLNEAYREKETAYENLKAAYEEAEARKYVPIQADLEVQACNLAMETIESLSGNIHHHVGDRLRQRTSQILGEITGGRYREVLMDRDFHMTVNTEERIIPLESLSRGTMEQIYFSLRMAAGELLCGEEQFPVILDDVFGMYDEERLTAVLHWLYQENRQVLISTCHKREMELLEQEGLPYNRVLL